MASQKPCSEPACPWQEEGSHPPGRMADDTNIYALLIYSNIMRQTMPETLHVFQIPVKNKEVCSTQHMPTPPRQIDWKLRSEKDFMTSQDGPHSSHLPPKHGP